MLGVCVFALAFLSINVFPRQRPKIAAPKSDFHHGQIPLNEKLPNMNRQHFNSKFVV